MMGEADRVIHEKRSRDLQIIKQDSFKVRLKGPFTYYIQHIGKTNQFQNL